MTEPIPAYPIRTATPDDLRAFAAPLMVAFGDELTDAQFEDWRHTLEPERLIAAFDGEAPIATAGAYTFRMTVPGGDVPAAGVTLVGVEPGHRRRGVLRALMRHQLDDVRARGEPVAILWASESAIYQRFGYGLGTLSGSFEIERGRTAWLRPCRSRRGGCASSASRRRSRRSRRSTSACGPSHRARSPAPAIGGAGARSTTRSTCAAAPGRSSATSTRSTARPRATRSTGRRATGTTAARRASSRSSRRSR